MRCLCVNFTRRLSALGWWCSVCSPQSKKSSLTKTITTTCTVCLVCASSKQPRLESCSCGMLLLLCVHVRFVSRLIAKLSCRVSIPTWLLLRCRPTEAKVAPPVLVAWHTHGDRSPQQSCAKCLQTFLASRGVHHPHGQKHNHGNRVRVVRVTLDKKGALDFVCQGKNGLPS